jgi:hypothetical protein
MRFKTFMDRQQSDQTPAWTASVLPLAADVGDAMAWLEPRREI